MRKLIEIARDRTVRYEKRIPHARPYTPTYEAETTPTPFEVRHRNTNYGPSMFQGTPPDDNLIAAFQEVFGKKSRSPNPDGVYKEVFGDDHFQPTPRQHEDDDYQ